ncbi:MAG: tRNA (guanosine(46)-N7)-methyltransferase TrmB [Rikenellaceae bacterium]
MGKDKLRKFAENLTFKCFVQPEFDDIFRKDHPLKGCWHRDFFGNDNPIVLELGCGKGEYTVALARRNPNNNYIGIDIKGARMWRGAKSATEEGLSNVAFLRTRIEFIDSFFGENEVSEIWITFPDPQLKRKRAKKRLTAPLFLELYAKMMREDGVINLKSDSQHLHNYTLEVAHRFNLPIAECCNDIYGSGFADEQLSIKTAYETIFVENGLPITYLRFGLGGGKAFDYFEWEEDEKMWREKDAEEQRKDIKTTNLQFKRGGEPPVKR